MREVKEGQIYKHFKGHVVKVLCIAKNTETNREEVIYEHMKTKDIWARDKEMFLEKLDHKKYPNVSNEYRFELIDNYVKE